MIKAGDYVFIGLFEGFWETPNLGHIVKVPFRVSVEVQNTMVVQFNELLEWIISARLHSPLGQLVCHRYLCSQLQKWIFRKRIWQENCSCFEES